MTKPVAPHLVKEFNENNTVILDVTHLNKSKALVTPSTVSYRIDDLTNNRVVLDWTSVSTPGSTNTITITKAQNALYNYTRDKETRQVTVNAVDSSGNASYDTFIYRLIRIFDQSSRVN